MSSMSLVMSPKVLVTSNSSATLRKSVLGNTVTYARKGRSWRLVRVGATPEKLSESIEQSIKTAEETCSENPDSGECAAAWDEVEEVSAAASHARANAKPIDPLDEYCKDNPETNECRTYDN